MTSELPTAELRPARRLPLIPLLVGLVAVLGGALTWSAWSARGPSLVLLARDGAGLRPGDALRYRGIRIGAVRSVELEEGLDQVRIEVRLEPASERVARAGSRFWIVRPRIGVDRIEGLETLLGARYLAVLPGAPDAAPQHEFLCLDEPPADPRGEAGGVEFVLEATRRMGLAPGAPLTYREVEVGRVLSVELASDARGVEVWCRVDAPFRALIREDTVFWRAGGLRFDLGWLAGLSVDVDSLRALLGGGIALGVPGLEREPVRTGARLALAESMPAGAPGWSPPVPIGDGAEALPRLPLLRARLTFERGFFGRDTARTGWVLALSTGLAGTERMLVPPEGADGPALEVHGQRFAVERPPLRDEDGVALRPWRFPDVPGLPGDRLRRMSDPEDCLLVGGTPARPIALAGARLRPQGDGAGRFRIDPALSFDAGQEGSAVVARSDGAVVGLLTVEDGRGSVVPLAPLVE